MSCRDKLSKENENKREILQSAPLQQYKLSPSLRVYGNKQIAKTEKILSVSCILVIKIG